MEPHALPPRDRRKLRQRIDRPRGRAAGVGDEDGRAETALFVTVDYAFEGVEAHPEARIRLTVSANWVFAGARDIRVTVTLQRPWRMQRVSETFVVTSTNTVLTSG